MRVKSVTRNVFFSMMGQAALIVVGFICQRVLNHYIGEELVGMNSVISNIIAVLSVTELGISTAIVYHLYDALAREDEREISALMNLYRKAYHIFAAAIFALGMCMLPFVHLFLKENHFSLSYIRMIYFLWLIRTVFSYLLSYRKSLLVADQKEYVISIVMLLVNVMNYSLVSVIVACSRRYGFALGCNIAVDVIGNLFLSWYIDQKYPYLRKNRDARPARARLQAVISNIKNIFVIRVAEKMFLCTDSLIVSSFVNVMWAGRFSNYSLVTNALINIARAVASAIQPSIGNMFTEKDGKKNYQVFRQISFLFFLFTAVAVCGVYNCITPFVRDYWLGQAYVMDDGVVRIFVVSFFAALMSVPVSMMLGVTGLFAQERNTALLSMFVNLTVSLGLVGTLGIYGVILGTVLTYIVQIVYRTYLFFRLYLKCPPYAYLSDMAQYVALVAAETLGVTWIAQHFLPGAGIVRLLLLICLSVAVPTGCNLLLYIGSWRLRSIAGLVRGMIANKK